MADAALTNPSNVPQPDAPGDLERLDAMITADEAEMAARQQSRDDQGKFTSAKAGARAPQRLTPAEVSAKDAKRTESPPTSAAPVPTAEQKPSDEPDAGKPAPEPEDKAGEQPAGEPQTPYARAKAREAAAWKKINEEKAAIELREKALEAREKAARQQRPAPATAQEQNGARYTAADYTRNAGIWDDQAGRLESRARELEESGDFSRADQAWQQAEEKRALAKAAREAAQRAPAVAPAAASDASADPEADARMAWAVVKTDLPEALVEGSALNKSLIEYIQRNPGVLQQPGGVYRAVIQTGRSIMARLERELGQAQAFKAELDKAQQQIKSLQDELQRVTSLPGGGVPPGLPGSGRSFGDLPAHEREQILERELVGAI